MLSGWIKIVALALVAAGLAGCASDPASYYGPPAREPQLTLAAPRQMPLQCALYAREHSSVKLYGDAWTWWDKAAGKFSRQPQPESGAVIVLAGYAGPERGHVAVVRSLISPREIHVDHANWLGDGAIYLDNPVADVSENNDWSRVRIWNIKTGGWGTRIYPVQGFIGPGSGDPFDQNQALPDATDPARIARAELGEIQ